VIEASASTRKVNVMYEAAVCNSSLDSFLHGADKLACSDVLQELAQVS
jgi:hypothetical protein